jgi:fluoride exporter
VTGFLTVALGGAIGSAARHGVNVLAGQWGQSFPYATFAVNVLGSFMMGLLAALLTTKLIGAETFRQFWLTGVLGGFTTFSAFSLDAFNLFQQGNTGTALIYVLASVGLSIMALVAGFSLALSLG